MVRLSHVYEVMMPRFELAVRRKAIKRLADYDIRHMERAFRFRMSEFVYGIIAEILMHTGMLMFTGEFEPEYGIMYLCLDPIKIFRPSQGAGVAVGQYVGLRGRERDAEKVRTCGPNTHIIFVEPDHSMPGSFRLNRSNLPGYVIDLIGHLSVEKIEVIEVMKLLLVKFEKLLDEVEKQVLPRCEN